ncbi:MAG: response regulator [Bdellovibrionaceae bacterium]|nr:response regulator [Pseudobdellovibrionaceae bacterium]
MALRVLLADESPTIKKVIQLALQDYSVEVKAVPVGIDVIPIAKVFQPDIIFVDVLLVKKSGYDVARDIKKDPDLNKTPVVLLWNSLMGIDENKARESAANKRLEKPFEVETLRSIVQELSPKTVNHPISSFLNFDEIDSIKDYRRESAEARKNVKPPQIPNFNIPEQSGDYIIEDSILPDELQLTEENEDFAQVPLHKKMPLDAPSLDNKVDLESPDEWQADPVNNLRPLNPQSPSINANATAGVLAEEDLMKAKRKITDSFEEIIFSDEEVEGTHLDPSKPVSPPQSVATSTPRQTSPEFAVPALSNIPLDAKTQEKIFREEVRVIAEKICWSLLPEITERVVREEIKKLLQEP